MEAQKLFIPDKIKVGFQGRAGTYTGKLAYVIYYDKNNVLRKETSWQNWRDKKYNPLDFDNVPTSGFVLNKGVGGARQSYGWNTRNEYIRVYDPRDFEFEISVSNLLFILRECDCSKGKGLEGEFVYAWDGKELVLLPTNSIDYTASKEYSNLQDKKIKKKELVHGYTYTHKDNYDLVYLGEFDHYVHRIGFYGGIMNGENKRCLVFWNGKKFEFFNDVKKIAMLKIDSCVANFAELVENYNKTQYSSQIKKIYTKECSFEDNIAIRGDYTYYRGFFEIKDVFYVIKAYIAENNELKNIDCRKSIFLNNENKYEISYKYGLAMTHDKQIKEMFASGKHNKLIVEFENGYELEYNDYC
jgi:hypothetical protein